MSAPTEKVACVYHFDQQRKSSEKEYTSVSPSSASCIDSPTDLDQPNRTDLSQAITNRTTKSSKSTFLDRITSRVTSTRAEQTPPPDGGLTAWTQCFLTWLVMFNTWGFVLAFAPFQTYYTARLGLPQSTISWIGSIQAFSMFFVGAFSGRALDAGLLRPAILVGLILQVLGMFMMSLSTKYWQLFITHGIMTGLGGGIIFCPMMGLLTTYFAKRRGVAVGLTTTGNSIGGIIIPLVVRQLLPKIGFPWTARILAFISLTTLSLVLAFARPRLAPRKAGPIIEWQAIRDVPYVLIVFAICASIAPVYWVYYYIASYARNIIHMPYTSSLNLAIIVNGVGIPARILPGFLADRFGVLNVFIPIIGAVSLMIFCFIAVEGIAGFYAWTVVFGLIGGAYQSLFPTAITSMSSDLSKNGTRLGMALSTIGFAALVGGPIGGALLSTDGGGYMPAQVWGGSSVAFAACLVIGARTARVGWLWRAKC